MSKDDFEAFFRQKPNRKLLRRFHFFVWWYNLFDQQKITEKKIKRNEKYDRLNSQKVRKFEKKNEKRVKKGKKPRTPKLKDKETPMLVESIRDIGERPVIYDSSLTEQTRFQLSKYLFSKGYFNNTVTDSAVFPKNKKKVYVKYYLFPGPSYTINSIRYVMEDKEIGALFLKDTVNSLLSRGMEYDEEKLQAERQRMTDLALNNGYFNFENAYIDYFIDTLVNTHTASMILKVHKFSRPYSSSNDSIVYVNHPQYRIHNVYIVTEPVVGDVRSAHFSDTVVSRRRGLVFLLNNPLAYRRRVITSNTDLYAGQLYRRDTAQQTYKQLLGLGLFKNVTIRFYKNENYVNKLDCYIVCNPLIKQSVTAETEGTNTDGNLGIDGHLAYQNRNFFKGGELVELKLQAAVAAQRNLNQDQEGGIQEVSDVNPGEIQKTFNTVQFGPELSFSVPRAFFPFSLLPFRRDQQPRTYIKTSFNYQTRRQFYRTISSVNYGFSFKTHNRQLKHDIILFEMYAVRAQLQPSFRNTLISLNDAFLLNSFQDHITTLTKYGLTFTSKENTVSGKRPAFFGRLNLMSSGNVLREVYMLTGQPKDTAGRYLMFGIPFAHFLKTDIDLRVYIPVRKRSRVVYRLAAGIGKPLVNLKVLPYEQSFFSGGPNSVRAWRARTLGPGGYFPPDTIHTRFDKIGDILLEGNFEYRFHIIRTFHGALFVDAGNVWRLEPDPSKPGGEFLVDKFAEQIAVGGGMGIRWDLTFFVLRLDLAMPLKYPKFEKVNAQQTFPNTSKPWNYTVANFGIGYPF